ncbi:MAG: hypothetical protein WD407_15490 [Rhodospirillales bacterium]
MSLAKKAVRVVVIVALLFGMGGFSAATGVANHHGDHGIAAAGGNHHASSHHESGSAPSGHTPDSEFGCCHSLACTGTAVFSASAVPFTDAAGRTIPLATMTVAQGQPIPPFKRPPKRTA